MPIYEYQCRKCQRRFEEIQKIDDQPLRRCRHCGGRLERLLSPVGIQFKGSGWYVTDYGRGSRGDGGDGTHKSSEEKETKAPEAKEKKEKTTEAKT